MNRIRFMIGLLLVVLMVASGCTEQYAGGDTTTSPVPTSNGGAVQATAAANATATAASSKKLNADEQLAMEFMQVFMLNTKGEDARKAFLDEKISPITKNLFQKLLVDMNGEALPAENLSVMESADFSEGGIKEKLVLFQLKIDSSQAEAIIGILDGKIAIAFFSEVDKGFYDLRKYFKTQVPKEVAEGKKNAEENAKPKLEVADKAGYAWKDSIGVVYAHSAFVLENTGKVPVNITDLQLNLEDTSGGILTTVSLVSARPSIVEPGETAFVGEDTLLDEIKDPALYKQTSINFSFEAAQRTAIHLELSNVKGGPFKGIYDGYKVTGYVKNQTDTLQKGAALAAGFFDKDGKLVGVTNSTISVGINSGSQAGFELIFDGVPLDVLKRIQSFEVKATAGMF
jgi:hypothetical protein